MEVYHGKKSHIQNWLLEQSGKFHYFMSFASGKVYLPLNLHYNLRSTTSSQIRPLHK